MLPLLAPVLQQDRASSKTRNYEVFLKGFVCLPASSPTPLLSLLAGKGRQSPGSRDGSRACVCPFHGSSPELLCHVSVHGAPMVSSTCSFHQGLHRRWGWGGIIPRAALALVPHPWVCVCPYTYLRESISFVLAHNDSLRFFFLVKLKEQRSTISNQ